MHLFVTIVHVIASGILILLILLHAGRGGGLSEMFGGSMMGGSTVAERNLDRLTVIAAVVFTMTTVGEFFLRRP
ncbi:MAG: preprotein translocase subunit SecG [Actinomycetota bacterium]